MTAAGKARGIIFRGDMVRAILDGRKTQTRRIVTLREFDRSGTPGYDWTFRDSEARWHDFRNADFLARKCPYGVPGDRLWVREAFASFDNVGRPIKPSDATYVVLRDGTQVYRDGVIVPCLAVYAPGASDHIRWRSSRFMPRWASRLTLVVEAVRVERLSAITDEDAVAEGFVGHASANVDGAVLSVEPGEQYLAAFRAMHNLAADADPWLWVVTFKKEPANG